MCFSSLFKPSHRCIEREIGVFGKDKGFHSVSHPSPSLQATLHFLGEQAKGLHLWYNLNSFVYDQRGRNFFMGSNDSVFGDSCQRGRKYEPKAKGLHHHQFQKLSTFQKYFFFQLVSYCVQKGEKVVFQKWYIKTLLNTKRSISFEGSFVKSKEKHLKRGKKISNLENALQTLIHLPLTICKRSLKWIYKRICKNKTCGANVVQNVK
jgi:hypothetical protein